MRKNTAALHYKNSKNSKQKHNPFIIRALELLAAAAFLIWFIISFIGINIEISQKTKEYDELAGRTSVLEMQNESYSNILSEENEHDFMERVATDELGYAYPNEKRFIDKNKN